MSRTQDISTRSGQTFRLTAKGMEEIEAAVAGLQGVDRTRAVKAGLRAGGNYLARQGRARLRQRNYKQGPGSKRPLSGRNLYNAFRVRVKRRSPGVLAGFSTLGHHAHLVDLGTRKRPHPRTGTSGVMPASQFWTDTAKGDWRRAMDSIVDGIRTAVARIGQRRG